MIKRETIKQAIDAISARDPEIGYALDEMLGMGKIDAPAPGEDPMIGNDFYFLFDRYRAKVGKFLYIDKGSVPIEERLLVKYGELLKKQELLEQGQDIDLPAARREIRLAGLKLMVDHEIDYAIARLKAQPGSPKAVSFFQAPDGASHRPATDPGHHSDPSDHRKHLIGFLEALKHNPRPLSLAGAGDAPGILFHGTVDRGIPSLFIRFPYLHDGLQQVADINIEFFHVRFLLNRLIRNQWQQLFACVVADRIVGLIYLELKPHLFYQHVELKYVASARQTMDLPTLQPPRALRGVGTFLVAGGWLYWKTRLQNARELLLDSEIGARGFYTAMGFQSRGMSEFILKTPKGHLLKTIVMMSRLNPRLDPAVYREITASIKKQVKGLCKKAKTEKALSARKAALDVVAECLKPGIHRELSDTAESMLKKYRKKIPEYDLLLQTPSEADFSRKADEDTQNATGIGY